MMKEETLNSWEDFEKVLVEMNEKTKLLQGKVASCVNRVLFRGVSNTKYHLESTIDRIQKGMCLSDYHGIVEIIHRHIETCTGRKWNLDTKVRLVGFELPAYEFMAYLRHNGFPSPLVDWTRSPYIAAFFAFRDVPSTVEYVSIFAYREYCREEGKSWQADNPHIQTLGHTIATDYKHYLQQSEYTICVKVQGTEIHFADYEDVKDKEEQEVLIKYNIPVSEQQKVLGQLDSMNITAYSLFGSEPSLMETLALREIILK